MEKLVFEYKGKYKVRKKAHVGVVGSSNMEVIFYPGSEDISKVKITTKFHGNKEIWRAVLDKFFQENNCIVNIEINDFGSTPGVAYLRLLQALEVAEIDKE